MKYIDEYRDAAAVRRLATALRQITTQSHTLMEVCGGQTHSIVKFGIDELLPPEISLIHGPGCPVCVTPVELVDRAVTIAAKSDVIFCSFGDMLRVPGTTKDLLAARAEGADVRVVYSPLDALELAWRNADRHVVFFAVGFETTAPANAMAVHRASEWGIRNFSVLVGQVLVPPALEAILSSPLNRVQGLLAAGHVCTVTGYEDYRPIAARYGVPIVVTGFEPLDILQGIIMCVRQLEKGRADVENQYSRSVREHGNEEAKRLMREVFRVVDRRWRGIGEIPASGLALSDRYREFDAELRFDLDDVAPDETGECVGGLILQGAKKPHDCAAFGTRCTPQRPLGALMVSSEGACSAYYRYRRLEMPPATGDSG